MSRREASPGYREILPQINDETIGAIRKQADQLSQKSLARMKKQEWFTSLPSHIHAEVLELTHTGIMLFAQWLKQDPPTDSHEHGEKKARKEVFSAAPLHLAALSLRERAELLQIARDVVTSEIVRNTEAFSPPQAMALHVKAEKFYGNLLFGLVEQGIETLEGNRERSVQAALIDALLDPNVALDQERTTRKAAVLGWDTVGSISAVVGRSGNGETAHRRGVPKTLSSSLGEKTLVLVRSEYNPDKVVEQARPHLGEGKIIFSGTAENIQQAAVPAREAVAAYNALRAWPNAPEVISADALLVERSHAGDEIAKKKLEDIYVALKGQPGGRDLLHTIDAFSASGSSLDGSARRLHLHPNTVRYRLKQMKETTGLDYRHSHQWGILIAALQVGRLREDQA